MADNGFTMRTSGETTAQCPNCDAWFAAASEQLAGMALVAHLNYYHDTPTDEEDR